MIAVRHCIAAQGDALVCLAAGPCRTHAGIVLAGQVALDEALALPEDLDAVLVGCAAGGALADRGPSAAGGTDRIGAAVVIGLTDDGEVGLVAAAEEKKCEEQGTVHVVS